MNIEHLKIICRIELDIDPGREKFCRVSFDIGPIRVNVMVRDGIKLV